MDTDCTGCSALGPTINVWWNATLQQRVVVYLPPAPPGPHQPGRLGDQFSIADLAARNPRDFANPYDARQSARRMIHRYPRRHQLREWGLR